jgi:hypothetical protein
MVQNQNYLDSNRDYYTRHGLHLNRKGKDLIAKKIALAIQDQLNTQKCVPIIMSHNLIQCDHRVTPTNEQGTRTVVEDAKHDMPTMNSTHSLWDEDEQTHRANVLKEIPKYPEDPQEDEPPTIPNNLTNDVSNGITPEAPGSSKTLEETQCDHRVTPTNEQGPRRDDEDAKHDMPTINSTLSLRDEDDRNQT